MAGSPGEWEMDIYILLACELSISADVIKISLPLRLF